MVRVLRALLASGMLVFALAVPAMANDLHNTTTDNVDGTDCDTTVVADGMVLYHFINTMTTGANLPDTITVTFTDADGVTQTVTADGYSNGNGHSVVMYDVTVPQGWTLVDASNGITVGQLNLSHICNGGPPPILPEAPIALLLPLVALGTIGGGLFVSRRRRVGSVA